MQYILESKELILNNKNPYTNYFFKSDFFQYIKN